MACPTDMTLKDLNGEWIMNKELSGDYNAALELQGLGWFVRKMITMTTVTLSVKQFQDPGTGNTHIDIEQTGTGGIKGSTEKRVLDWTQRDTTSPLFGHIKGRSRWTSLKDIEDPFLSEGFEQAAEDQVILAEAQNVDNGSLAQQVWGFEVIEGKRYYVRHVVVEKEGQKRQVKLVYDWQGNKNEGSDEEKTPEAEE